MIVDELKEAMATIGGIRPYFGELPRNMSFPAIRYTPVGGTTAGHLRGESDLRNMVVQVDVYSKTLSEALGLAEAARCILTARPLYGTLQVAPLSLPEVGLDAEHVTFQVSIWGSA